MKKLSLDDYLVGLTGKSKLIIYLIASGNYTFDQIRSMSVEELINLRNSIKRNKDDLLDIVDELTLQRDPDEYAFLYTSGRRYSANNIRDILVRAHERCKAPYKGLAHFVTTIKGK